MLIQKPIQNLAVVVFQATDYRHFVNSITFDLSCQIIEEKIMGRAYDGFQKQIYSKEQKMNVTKKENVGQGRESQRRNEASLSEEKLYNVR